MMTSPNFSSFTLVAIEAALKAGKILKEGFGTNFEISTKPGRQNFVTIYDKKSEECIISHIQHYFPSHNFLAEESGWNSPLKEEEIVWIIDPLDGTTNFAHHIPLFTISIAGYLREKGVCGVIYQPLTEELFVTERGKGAYLNEKQLRASQTNQIEEGFLIVSLPYDLSSIPIFDLKKLLDITQKGVTIRNLGSAALSLAYVAAGKADAFWMYQLQPWDLAAGKLLIEEAGGLLTRFESPESFLHAPSNILASNQALHSSLKIFLT